MLERENVKKAINMIRSHSDYRKIIINDRKELPFPSNALGAIAILDPKKIFVYVTSDYPEHIQECILIHELLHLVLWHEGFPRVVINKHKIRNENTDAIKTLEMIAARFSSVVQHPQIYHRMNEFNVDLDSYFEVKVDRSTKEFNKTIKSETYKNYYLIRQQKILFGLDYYSYPPKHRKIIQKVFRDNYPEAYIYCNRLHGQLNFNSPSKAKTSAKKLKKSIMKFGKGNTTINRFLDALDIK